MKRHSLILSLVLLGAPLGAQDTTSFDDAASDVRRALEESVAELTQLRADIVEEQIPLNQELNALQQELIEVRAEFQDTTRLLDTRTFDLSLLERDIKTRREETSYLSNLLGEYVRNFESRLHISELKRYEEVLEAAKLAPENANLSEEEVYAAQTELLAASLDRLHESVGGLRFEGTAVGPDGLVHQGTFLLMGPSALFRSEDGKVIGTAEQRLGSLEPTTMTFANLEDTQAAESLLAGSGGFFPFDPTLGDAHKVEATEKETILDEVKKGGFVMIPIFVMAGLALLVALGKWLGLTLTPKPSKKKIAALLDAVAKRDEEAAQSRVKAIKGPVGRMLAAGVEHIREPRDLIEEVMYEKVLIAKLKAQRFLPFIAICAASAPLLGLLGTVTGIIRTFKLITIFGSGDVKSLSGGISEALITTKFGLIVAIPSLLLHAYLSRKAKGVTNQMETSAVAFANQVSKTPLNPRRERTAESMMLDPDLVKAQVSEILNDMLGPLAKEHLAAPTVPPSAPAASMTTPPRRPPESEDFPLNIPQPTSAE